MLRSGGSRILKKRFHGLVDPRCRGLGAALKRFGSLKIHYLLKSTINYILIVIVVMYNHY